MSQRTRLAALSSDLVGQEICLRGWLRTVRNSKKFSFLNLNDGSTQSGIQIIADAGLPDYEEIAKLTTGSAVEVIGQLVESPGKGQAFEVQTQQIRIYGRSPGEDYPLQKKRSHPRIPARNCPPPTTNQYFWCCLQNQEHTR